MNASHDLFKTDASDRERAVLDSVLAADVSEAMVPVPRVPIKEARHGATQMEIMSTRDTTRILFISRDTTLLNQTTQSLDGYLNLADVFDEVHIMVLQQGGTPRNPVLRVAPNVWLYVVSGRYEWWLPVTALRMIAEQMLFADGFRPDLIVARDPYESAVVAVIAGRHYGRPTQLHMHYALNDKKAASRSSLYRIAAPFLIKRFLSIRTSTEILAGTLTKQYPQIPDIKVLPRFHNYTQQHVQSIEQNIKTIYRQFAFVIAYVGPLDRAALAYQALDAVRGLLHNPQIGLVFFGDGPARRELEKRAELLGVTTQIAFERESGALASYLASVDVLIVPEATPAADEVVIMAAFAKVPIVAVATPLRSDLFLHEESALLSGSDDVAALGAHVNQVLNDSSLRHLMREKAYDVVSARLHEDPDVYRLQYRDSVEAALFVGEDGVVPNDDVTAESSKV